MKTRSSGRRREPAKTKSLAKQPFNLRSKRDASNPTSGTDGGKRALRRVKRMKPRHANFECGHCRSPFSTPQALKKHVNHFHGGPETCSVCAKVFPNLSQLRSHLRRAERYGDDGHMKKNVAVVKQKPKAVSACMYCLKIFPTRGELMSHQQLMKGTQDKEHDESIKNDPVVCHICSHYYKTRHAFKTHYVDAHINKVKCRYCGEGFQFEKGRNEHERNTCRLRNKGKLDKAQPKTTDLPDPSSSITEKVMPALPFLDVSEIETTFSELNLGQMSKNNSKDTTVVNPRASRKRTRDDMDSIPTRMTTRAKKVCRSIFRNDVTLDMVSKLFITSAQKLDEQFKQLSLDDTTKDRRETETPDLPCTPLIIETRLVKGMEDLELLNDEDEEEAAEIKRIVCETCNRSFTRKDSLTRHIRRTHIVKPVKCPECPKLLPNPERLKSHTTSVHRRGYTCETCGVFCKTSNELKSHQFRTHSNK